MARFNALFLAAFVAFAAAAPTALASHNGNNAAELSGRGDRGATGKAIVNSPRAAVITTARSPFGTSNPA